ncbi:MAG TPA: cytochrome c peroxidase [Croceibacterium sp.]|nr:cytochrome c peroxidase [Croceibacterium sp.]
MRGVTAALLALSALIVGTAASRPAEWRWNLPEGVAPPPVPADNPMSVAKVELGRRLFHDADLSIDGTMSCATCHSQRRGFADRTSTRPGVHGDPGKHNVPGLANVAYLTPLTWADPRQTRLQEQALVPVFGDHPVEMGMKGQEAELARRLGGDRCYRRMFRAAFPETRGRIDAEAVAKALAAFQRTMLSFNSAYDRYRRGESGAAPSSEALAGEGLFTRHCTACHAGENFTDQRFHALSHGATATDGGLGEITGLTEDHGRFRTPGLRNVALSGPYFHDGSLETIAEAIAQHGGTVPAFSEVERDALLAFLDTLTDQDFASNQSFGYPEKACGKPLL